MIPNYQECMLPLLQLLSDNQVHTSKECVEKLSVTLELTEEEKSELLPSGKQTIISNRVSWARFYLEKAGLVKVISRGKYQITQEGVNLLAEHPTIINNDILYRYDQFLEFMKQGSTKGNNDNNNIKALSHMALGKIYDDSSLINTSLNHYIAACSYGGEIDNTKLQSFALYDIGKIYASRYNKDAAFDFIETAKNIACDTKDSKTIGKIYSKSAKTYKHFNENLQALKDLKVSTIEYDKTTNNSKNLVENYIMAASILIDLNNTKKAKSLLNKAMNIANEAKLSQYLPQINNLNKFII